MKKAKKQMAAAERMERAMAAWVKANRAWREAMDLDCLREAQRLEKQADRAMLKADAARHAYVRAIGL